MKPIAQSIAATAALGVLTYMVVLGLLPAWAVGVAAAFVLIRVLGDQR